MINAEYRRIVVILRPDLLKQLEYWSKKQNMTINEYLGRALDMYVAFEKSDHAIPNKRIKRLNTCTDSVETLRKSIGTLQNAINEGFDNLLILTRGDNAFCQEFDGDVDPIVPEGKYK